MAHEPSHSIMKEGVVDSFRNYKNYLDDKLHKWKLLRYRAASLAQFTGVSELKQKIKTKLGINAIQRWTPSRIKQRVLSKIGIYNNPIMTKLREIGKNKWVRSLNNIRHEKPHHIRFPKLKTDSQKARTYKSIPKSKFAYKPVKAKKDVTKLDK